MIKFNGKILQFGFGAVGKSFYEKLRGEVKFDPNKYFVITANPDEFKAYINLDGVAANFKVCTVTRENYGEVFGTFLSEGDLLIDFAESVGTREFCEWCAERNIMYINTGETDWPDHWYSIFEENGLKRELQEKYRNIPEKNRYPIVLHHGNNPGLVSHFVKEGISYIARTQFRKDKKLKTMIQKGAFAEAAEYLDIRTIHVNDIDSQKLKEMPGEGVLISTWCTESYWFELLSEATVNVGTHESVTNAGEYRSYNEEKGYLEYYTLAAEKMCRTFYPEGSFTGHVVPHEETVSIAQSLEVKRDGVVAYRPTVIFIYRPSPYADAFLRTAKVNEYPNPDPEKPQDCDIPGGEVITRGYRYPKKDEILYREKTEEGTEYVGVLIMGSRFDPVWVGNRIEPEFLYKKEAGSYWQTPTITPVAMSALSAVCWMIKNQKKGGIYFPDDIPQYHEIVKFAEKYISPTLYKTFSKSRVNQAIGTTLTNYTLDEFLV